MNRKNQLIAVVVWIVAMSPVMAAPLSPSEIPAAAFAQLPLMRDADLSPDGRYIAYFQTLNGRSHLFIQPVDSVEDRVILPPWESLDFLRMRWANNDRLVFSMYFSVGRSKRVRNTTLTHTHLASIDKKASDMRWIVKALPTARKKDYKKNPMVPSQQDDVIDWLPDDPDHILVSLDENFDGGREVRKINVATADNKTIVAGFDGIQRWITDQSGEVRFGYGYGRNNEQAVLKKANGKWTSMGKSDWFERDYRPIAFTSDPEIAYVIGPNESGINVLRTMRLSDGTFIETIFEAGPYDVADLVVDPVSQKPVGAAYVDHYRQINYFDPVLKGLQQSLDQALPQSHNTIVDMSDDRMKLLVRSSSDTNPGVYYYWDRHSKQMAVFANAMPGLPTELLSATEAIEYQSRDETTISGYLTIPKGLPANKLPAVILPHGGPNSRSHSGFSYLAQFLASRGYAVLQPNFRGSTGYGKDFEDAGDSQWGGVMQDDVTDGARWLIDEGIADADRLCIAGSSYGGYAAVMGAIKTPDLYHCAISINGVLNLPGIMTKSKYYVGSNVWTKSIGLEGEELKAVSPFHQAEKIEIPILIIHATDDATVPNVQARSMTNKLRGMKKPVESVTVELGGHGMNNDEARLAILTSTEAFLNRHIGADRKPTE